MAPTYPFRQGLDYGPLTQPRGLEFHMTEGNGTIADVNYLARRAGETVSAWRSRVSGVSAHAVNIDDGTVWQMVDWTHCSGNLNPDDRAAEYGYYGGSNLRAVLGDGWTNPNEYSLSMEIAGKRADGPTAAQVRSAIAWGLDMRSRFPTIRGAYGHHDQSTKACPGLTSNMKAIFAGVGGHGLFPVVEDDVIGLHLTYPAGVIAGSLSIPAGTEAVRVADRVAYDTTVDAVRSAVVVQNIGGSLGYLVDMRGDEAHFIRGSAVGLVFKATVLPPDAASVLAISNLENQVRDLSSRVAAGDALRTLAVNFAASVNALPS